MALITSAASGNFNAGATWTGGVVPTTGDEARASTGHTITITANATCTEISNAGSGTFVLNSGVTLTANVTNKTTTVNVNCLYFSAASPATATIVGNVTGGAASNGSPIAGTGAILNSSSGTLLVQGNVVGGTNVICIGAFNASTGTISVTGNVTGGTGNTCIGIYNVSTGTISISGNVAGGSGANANGAINAAAGTYTITGNVSGGTISTAIGVSNGSGTVTITSTTISSTVAIAVSNLVGGTVNVTGNVTGGTAANIYGLNNAGVGTINVTGNVTGGTVVATSHGLNNASTGIVAVTGICTGGAAGAAGANNASTGTVRATRAVGNAYGPANSAGLVASVGVLNAALGICEIEQLEYGTFGMSPTSGTGIRLKKANTNAAVFNYADTAGAKTLIDATTNAAMPAATDVRFGTSYASGALTGSAYIPAAASVASGVPVDATLGTATLTAANVRTALGMASANMDTQLSVLSNLDTTVSSRLAPSGTLATVTTLTNAPTVPTAAAIASQVRTELSVELGRVDQNISSRLAAADYTAPSAAPTVAAIRTEMDSNSTKLANLDATVSSRLASSAYSAAPTTAQIATAVEGSLLNEADGQAVLNAIVGAIGNQNLSEVSLVAAVRADLERVGGKLDSIPTTAAPTAAANATAVWATATKEITGGTVTTLTNAPSVPSAASIASATRTELATELGRLDAAVSTRLASSGYTAPANSDVAAIKAKTDALNTDRLANVATTAIVGNLIAQANS